MALKGRLMQVSDRFAISSLRRPGGQSRLLRREIQVRHSPQIEESALARAYEPKQHMVAHSAPRNESRTIYIQMSVGKAPLRPAIRTLSFGGGQIHSKYPAEFTAGGIAVQITDICIHLRSPVEPKRS
ncbi:MAG: hypothetical protein WA437_09645, partial [Candidatus Sulfotelmatobacter sp.]